MQDTLDNGFTVLGLHSPPHMCLHDPSLPLVFCGCATLLLHHEGIAVAINISCLKLKGRRPSSPGDHICGLLSLQGQFCGLPGHKETCTLLSLCQTTYEPKQPCILALPELHIDFQQANTQDIFLGIYVPDNVICKSVSNSELGECQGTIVPFCVKILVSFLLE